MNWLTNLFRKLVGHQAPPPPPSAYQSSHPPERRHLVKASSFADPADVAAFLRCKAQGNTDQYCFRYGDNGRGCWGDDTTALEPMCALPPDDMEERWGSIAAAKHRVVKVTVGDRTVRCVLADRMPRRANIKNGAGIDLNPAACRALGLNPPIMTPATWEWLA